MSEYTPVFSIDDVGNTVAHPVGVCMLLLCGILLLTLPRNYALWPFLILVCFVSARQCIAIAGFNLYFPRFMILVFAPMRVIIRGEFRQVRWNKLDILIIAFGIWYCVAGALNWGFDPADLKTRSGYSVEIIGTYLVCRVMIIDRAAARGVVQCLAFIACVLLGFFLLENRTGYNIFSVFGGVPAITEQRAGRLRCQGAFGHPLLAGTFWATLVPLFLYGAFGEQKHRLTFRLGLLSSVGIVILTASSTPLLGLTISVGGWLLYRLRNHSRTAFYASIIALFALHLVMHAPVWSLIQRINVTSGNSGYHRYLLVDGFITHFHEWWLLGSTVGTSHWGHYTFDTANQFVAAGISSGLIGLALFAGTLFTAIRWSSRLWATDPRLGWALGVSMASLTVSFLGISIWGQLHLAFSLPVALTASLCGMASNPLRSSQAVGTGRGRATRPAAPRSLPVAMRLMTSGRLEEGRR